MSIEPVERQCTKCGQMFICSLTERSTKCCDCDPVPEGEYDTRMNEVRVKQTKTLTNFNGIYSCLEDGCGAQNGFHVSLGWGDRGTLTMRCAECDAIHHIDVSIDIAECKT